MNLKDAIRYYNHIHSLCLAPAVFSLDSAFMRTETTYLRSKMVSGAEDLVVAQEPSLPLYVEHICELEKFLLYLLKEQEILGKAIREAKANLPIDPDQESVLNHQRRSIATALRRISEMRPSEKLIPGGGHGYTFNAEGNQVEYLCDAKEVTTLSFTPAPLGGTARLLFEQADAMDARMDTVQINTFVDYDPPFDISDTFETAFQKYLKKDTQRREPPTPFLNT